MKDRVIPIVLGRFVVLVPLAGCKPGWMQNELLYACCASSAFQQPFQMQGPRAPRPRIVHKSLTLARRVASWRGPTGKP